MAKKKRKPVSKPATAPATVKQFACTADLLTTAKHYLGEINRPYVLIIEGIPDLLTNMPLPHARRILDDAAIFQDKLLEDCLKCFQMVSQLTSKIQRKMVFLA